MAFNSLNLRFPSIAVPGNIRLEMLMTQLAEHLARIETKVDKLEAFCLSMKDEQEKKQEKKDDNDSQKKIEKKGTERTLSGTHLAGMVDEFFIIDDYGSATSRAPVENTKESLNTDAKTARWL